MLTSVECKHTARTMLQDTWHAKWKIYFLPSTLRGQYTHIIYGNSAYLHIKSVDVVIVVTERKQLREQPKKMWRYENNKHDKLL